jgi:serine/threonine protein kinase
MKQKKTIKRNRLIASGGQGCIFKPALRCNSSTKKNTQKKNTQKKNTQKKNTQKKNTKKHTRTHKQNTNTISKVTYHRRSSNREYEMNLVVRKIPGYSKWAVVWDDYCDTQPYQTISKTSDITKCLDKKMIKPTKKETFPMLIGSYEGTSLEEFAYESWTPSVFDSQTRFDKSLYALYKLLRGVETGISEMKSHGLCHGDLSSGNVIIKGGKSKIIDFGLSCTVSQLSYLSKRLRFISQIDRIYEPYPLEYMCNGMNKKQLKEELSNFRDRDRFDSYVSIYETVLRIPKKETHVEEYLQERIKGIRKPRSVDYIFENIDTYSLGVMIPTVLSDVSAMCEVSPELLQSLCENSRHQDIFDFCKDKMSVFDV